MPPAPGCHFGPVPCPRRPESSCQLSPPSVDLNNAASSMPAKTVFGSVREGSKCQTRLNSQGCWVPSYHMCVVSGAPVSGETSYGKRLLGLGGHASVAGFSSFGTPGWNQVLPPSSDLCTTCPNHPLVCDA